MMVSSGRHCLEFLKYRQNSAKMQSADFDVMFMYTCQKDYATRRCFARSTAALVRSLTASASSLHDFAGFRATPSHSCAAAPRNELRQTPSYLSLPTSPHHPHKLAPALSIASISFSLHAFLWNRAGNSSRSHASPFSGRTLPSSCPLWPPMLP